MRIRSAAWSTESELSFNFYYSYTSIQFSSHVDHNVKVYCAVVRFLFEWNIKMNTWEIITLETSPKQNYEALTYIEIQMLTPIVRVFHQAVIHF